MLESSAALTIPFEGRRHASQTSCVCGLSSHFLRFKHLPLRYKQAIPSLYVTRQACNCYIRISKQFYCPTQSRYVTELCPVRGAIVANHLSSAPAYHKLRNGDIHLQLRAVAAYVQQTLQNERNAWRCFPNCIHHRGSGSSDSQSPRQRLSCIKR